MKKIYFLQIFVCMLLLSSCATVYKSPDLKARAPKHKEIAFIPFDAVIQLKKLPKGVSAEQVKQMEADMGLVFQEQMYTRFLKKQKKYNVQIQDVAMTNAILRKNNVTVENIHQFTKEELAHMLDVYAVVSGKVLTSRPMSNGGAIAIAALTGISTSTNKVDINVSLHDGLDSKLLFKYDHSFRGGLGSDPESISKALMKDLSKKFPYKI
ncbi:hypothetical protein KIH41_09985 [Litoribacter ruber]|uniref:hypothetical protein n=1 Tax=Litoribacter ruber TaxID=702568 RepID=UPI001BD99920|nr:hypothetical protein [Litoribacter ruber]MBT0811606.1 hypothetical protein [Litoribacter ruber]